MGSLAIAEAAHRTPHFPQWTTMLENGAHRSEHSPYESPYRSRSASSSRRTTSQPRNPITPSSSRPSNSAVSDLIGATPSTSIPRRESVSRAAAAPRPSSPPSPKIGPSHDVVPPAVRDAEPASTEDKQAADASSHSSPSTSTSHVSSSGSPVCIKVKNLQHIHNFLRDDNFPLGNGESTPQLSRLDDSGRAPQYEISGMPITDVIEMVAGLLTKITTTNDRQHEHLHRHIPSSEGAASLSQQTASVLAFHGKNVPSISILSYLSRIHKYCPTTYEVFISLLVYFDRMTEKVNSSLMQGMRDAKERSSGGRSTNPGSGSPRQDLQDYGDTSESASTPPLYLPDEMQADGQSSHRRVPGRPDRNPGTPREPISPPLSDSDPYNLAQLFVVDSYNIHRLVIAAVTCASKYFSDVFYTNSRYAKVGGLPLVELNHLEMQFLLLNDFRLAIPVEELEAYATMLVEFYGREVVAQQRNDGMEGVEATARSE